MAYGSVNVPGDLSGKQDKLIGQPGQVVGFGADGRAIAQERPVPTTRKVNGKALSTDITLSAEDVGAAASNHAHDDYAPKASPVFTGSVSLGRKSETTVGESSSVLGIDAEASGRASHAEGKATTASGINSHAEGYSTVASGSASHAEGGAFEDSEGNKATAYAAHAEGASTEASGEQSHAEGGRTIASGNNSHAEGRSTTASGLNSHAEGYSTVASGSASHAEGGTFAGKEGSKATEYAAHAEGSSTTASGPQSHAEGGSTTASGVDSHAEGEATKALEEAAHSEGRNTIASGKYSHAEGFGTETSGEAAHAEGSNTIASGIAAHAEGHQTVASVQYAHAEGLETEASGFESHAEGYRTVSFGWYSHAAGRGTIAEYASETAVGKYNVKKNVSEQNKAGDFFVVGKGSSDTDRANAFRVSNSGVYGTSAFNATGADYAELFEWLDGNPDHEDRCGRFVTLDGEKIRLAGPADDYILGIVSGNPSIVGGVHDDQWRGMYLYDIFGRPLWEDVEAPEETVERPDPEDPGQTVIEVICPAHVEHRQKLSPAYDSAQPYQPRSQRPEWDAVGMLGKLVVVDDGTCQVNGWCAPGEGGQATASPDRTKFRVLSRLDGTHVRVLVLA